MNYCDSPNSLFLQSRIINYFIKKKLIMLNLKKKKKKEEKK